MSRLNSGIHCSPHFLTIFLIKLRTEVLFRERPQFPFQMEEPPALFTSSSDQHCRQAQRSSQADSKARQLQELCPMIIIFRFLVPRIRCYNSINNQNPTESHPESLQVSSNGKPSSRNMKYSHQFSFFFLPEKSRTHLLRLGVVVIVVIERLIPSGTTSSGGTA